jgi:cholesterol oxidase
MTTTAETPIKRTRSLSKGFVDLLVRICEKPDFVFDVVIVGSGYGGSIAAQQLAGLKNKDGEALKIAVLERGSEYLPGMFPSSFADIPKHVRFATQATGKVTGALEGLYDIRLGDDVNALVANGLGGGSLINAGVMLEPDFATFKSELPSSLINDLTKPNGGYLHQAKNLLLQEPLALGTQQNTIRRHNQYGGNPQPEFPLKFHRLQDLAKGAAQIDSGVRFEAAEISVAMQPVEANPYGIKLNACVACGDCMTGCNVGAKASLNTNLLAQAARDGVDIYTGASVLSMKRMVEKAGGRFESDDTKVWQLDVVHTSLSLRERTPSDKKSKHGNDSSEPPTVIRSHHVILASGTFGSTEILLRSRSASLVFSNTLGEKFSCNGDNIAAIHDMPKAAQCTDDEFQALRARDVGPTITGTIKVPKKSNVELGYLIQEFSVPAPLKRIFEELVTTTKVVNAIATKDMDTHGNEANRPNAYDPCAVNPEAMKKSLLLGIIGHDDARGVLQLPIQLASQGIREEQEGALKIVWPQARKSHHLDKSFRRLVSYSKKAFGAKKTTVISNPMWRFLPENIEMIFKQERGPVLTVHPLGGCAIGETNNDGVVDEFGAVFDAGSQPYDKWEGTLCVLDGAMIPGSLGVNPSLTISAIALRGIQQFKKNLQYQDAAKSTTNLTDQIIFSEAEPLITQIPNTASDQETEIKVTERLSGKVTLLNTQSQLEDYVLELTLKYQPKPLKDLMSTWGGRRQQVATGSYLQLFKYSDWLDGLQLRVATDRVREEHAVFKVDVSGYLDFFGREKKTTGLFFKTFLALMCNRGFRDVWGHFAHKSKKQENIDEIDAEKKSKFAKFKIFICSLINVVHRAGEVRTFKYELNTIPNCVVGLDPAKAYFINMFDSKPICGEKRLTYNRRANPWKQMLEMRLTAFPQLDLNKKALLTVDTRFLANQGIALAEISKQKNQMNALLDMASFGLFMARVIFNNHMLSFRAPDATLVRTEPNRLPGKLSDLPDPEITEIVVVNKDPIYNKPPASIRLTRYKGKSGTAGKNPVVFIHGYSVSGMTFAHPSLKPSIAEYLWKGGSDDASKRGERDVWILDLRTSSGLPTATLPWSYEEVALVDIPTALLHIKNITGKKVDVVAHCVGAAMLSMAILTRASDVKTNTIQLGVETFIPNSQLGILSTFNGDGRFVESRAVTEQHPTINSIILSQKGPLIRYTEENIFRAYMMKYLQRWIAPEGYAFRASDSPTATEQLIDRLLSTLPYPDEEYDLENPKRPCARTEWVSSRHRMDVLYGRAFNAKAMSPEALNCGDDFYGPMNMETLLQTIHFVRFNCITNQRGRGEFVTIKNLRDRWHGIPTLSIHGCENGMVDPTTYNLTKANFAAAGLSYAGKVYPDHGHQDIFIGKDCAEVFGDIQDFLNNPLSVIAKLQQANKSPAQSGVKPVSFHIETPWIGPRLYEDAAGNLQVRAMSSPKYGKSQLIFIPLNNFSSGKNYIRASNMQLSIASQLTSQEWHSQDIATLINNNAGISWLVLMAYDIDQTLIDPADGYAANSVVPPATTVLSANNNTSLANAIDTWLIANKENLDHCVVTSEAIESWQKQDKLVVSFSLASCQYPPGVMDKTVSETSMQIMAELIKTGGVDLAIFAGDQIYADATAGLMDPSRKDERLDLPYEVALRTRPLQNIMRHVPVHMLPDDHEIVDNWQPNKIRSSLPLNNFEFKKQNKTLLEGIVAYWKYQRMEPVNKDAKSKDILDKKISYSFDHGCATFYMLDTRTKREFRKTGDPQSGKLFSDAEFKDLSKWLLDNKEKIKFITTPSILLPRRLATLNSGADYAAREDAWNGYPATMEKVLSFIYEHQIKNIVFLSGDEHVCCVAKSSISSNKDKSSPTGKKPITIYSVHASGLYAPYPFANGKPADFIKDQDVFDLGNTHVDVSHVVFENADKHFAKITASCTNSTLSVKVEFFDSTGNSTTRNIQF